MDDSDTDLDATTETTDDSATGTTDDSADERAAATTCECCGDHEGLDFEAAVREVKREHTASILTPGEGSTVLDVELPADLQAAIGELLGDGSVETLGDWVGAVRRHTGGGAIDFEDLCHEREPTGHWGLLDGERHDFACFYDAVVMAALVDRPVDVRTESPAGTEVTAHATGDGSVTAEPPGTVVSFGVDSDAGSGDGDPTREDVYQSVCPYVKAFATPETYERWDELVPAPTVAMDLEDATALAAALVE